VIVLVDFGSVSCLECCLELDADYFLDEAVDLEAVPRILSLLKRLAATRRPQSEVPGTVAMVQSRTAVRVVGQEARS
jgi:hypothetical protein